MTALNLTTNMTNMNTECADNAYIFYCSFPGLSMQMTITTVRDSDIKWWLPLHGSVFQDDVL